MKASRTHSNNTRCAALAFACVLLLAAIAQGEYFGGSGGEGGLGEGGTSN